MIQESRSMEIDSLTPELEDLKRIDWSDLWAGPPAPGTRALREWCDRYGWEPRTAEGDLEVVTRHGNTLILASNGHWHPVVALHCGELWIGRTDDSAEKKEVVSRGTERWERIRSCVTETWGSPDWSGAAGDETYPESPVAGSWPRPLSPQDNPYRMAFWSSSENGRGAVLLLEQSVAAFTWTGHSGAVSMVTLAVEPSAETSARG